jgi:hypothetical protein
VKADFFIMASRAPAAAALVVIGRGGDGVKPNEGIFTPGAAEGAAGAGVTGFGAAGGCGATTGATATGASVFFLIFVGNVRMSLVPGSAFSATAPPPCAARIVFTRASFNPVPASWSEAGCLGS